MISFTELNKEYNDLFETLSIENNEQINEGKITRALSRFWKWLIGDKKDKKAKSYLASSYNFNNLGDYKYVQFDDKEEIKTSRISKFIISSKNGPNTLEKIKKFVDSNQAGFKTFDDIIRKNDGHFPYIEDNQLNGGFIFYYTEDSKSLKASPIAIIAFVDSKYAQKIHKKHNDTGDEATYAYIYNIEIIPEFRKQKLMKKILDGLSTYLEKQYEYGITLQAPDADFQKTFEKYGFETYNETERYMSKKLKV